MLREYEEDLDAENDSCGTCRYWYRWGSCHNMNSVKYTWNTDEKDVCGGYAPSSSYREDGYDAWDGA